MLTLGGGMVLRHLTIESYADSRLRLARSSASTAQGVFGPRVARVAPPEFTAHRRIVARPEAREVCRHLHGPTVGREQLQHERDAPAGDARPVAHAEEVLHARSDVGSAPALVTH